MSSMTRTPTLAMLIPVAGLAIACAACSDDGQASPAADQGLPDQRQAVDRGANGADGGGAVTNVDVMAAIAADTTWTADHTYTLKTHVFVTAGTLTIEPGVVVLGGSGTSLVITQDARLRAEGTAERPIVFTSAKPAGSRARGDWGGLVLLGKAQVNVTGGSEKIEGFPAAQTGTSYGGSDDGHDCGTLRYARIEFAGFELAPDNELNGLTLGGCGASTVVDFVQVHMGADDGVEAFGGTVNLKHVVITQTDDDGLDWDFGWRGKAQFLVVQQNAANGNYGIEADNNKNDNDAAPRSAPQIWNATLVGSGAEPGKAGKLQAAALFRRGTAATIGNAIFAHFADFPIDVADAATVAQAQSGKLAVTSSIFFDNANASDKWPAEPKDNDEGFDEGAHLAGAAYKNRFVDPQLGAALDLVAPSFVPRSGSPALSDGAPPPADAFFDAAATHVGAFGAADWTAGWTAFPPR